MKELKKHLIFIIVLLMLFGVSKILSLPQFQNQETNKIALTQIQTISQTLNDLYASHPYAVPIIFSVSFFLVIIFYVPFVGTVYCLLAGALFNFYSGIILFSFLVSISYTTSFIISRNFLYNYIQKKLGKKGRTLVKGFEKDGLLYLLSLRLCGVVPGSVVNAAMGITKVSVLKFYASTQLGTFPHVVVAFYTGSQLMKIKSLDEMTSNKFFVFLFVCSMAPIVFKIIGNLILNCKKETVYSD